MSKNEMSLRAKRSREASQTFLGDCFVAIAPRNDTRREWTILLCVIVLFAFALRMFRVSELLMWGDEGFSVFSASRDLLTITLDTTSIDPHPPLYYYLLHFYFQIAGRSELAIRFFSVFFGTATIALAWTTGKRMFDARVGMLAAFLAAIAPFAVHYSQEVRMYALALFLAALGLYLFVRLLDREISTSCHFEERSDEKSLGNSEISCGVYAKREHNERTRNDRRTLWIGYAGVMLLALYTLYHTAFLFLAQGLVLLPLFKTRRAFVVRWFAVSFGIGATFLPWLLFRYASAFTGIKDVAGDTTPMDLVTFAARGFAAISVGTTIPLSNAFQLAGVYALLIALALVIALVTRTAKIYDALLLWLTVVPIVAYYPLYLALPLYRGRLFALACIPLIMLIARSTTIITQRARLAIIPIGLLLVGTSAYSINNYYINYNRYSAVVEDYLPLIHSIEQRAQPGDIVLFHAYWHQGYFLSHYRGAPLEYRALDRQNDLDAAVSTTRNVWAIVQALSHHGAEDWLAQNAFALGEENFGQMRLLSYRAGTPARGETFTTPVAFSNGIALRGYHLNAAPIEAGRGIATIQLDWQATQKIASDYTVSVRITNLRDDVIWAQADNQPAGGTLRTSTWQPQQIVRDYHALTIPVGTPPGEYAIQVVLYDSQSGSAANIGAPENRRGQALTLGNISIERRGVQLNVPAPPNAINTQWNEIALVGFGNSPDQVSAGATLPLTLYWRAQQKPSRDYLATIQVIDSSGAIRASTRYRPANEAFPTRAWDAGETWLDKVALPIAAESKAGDAKISIGLTDEQGNAIAPAIELTRVRINAREHRFDLPSPQFPLQATLGKIKLLGYDLDATPLSLTLYWQAIDPLRGSERYTVFIHLLDATGNIVAQRDSEPQSGSAPTTSWLKGEVVADTHIIDLPKNLAADEYWVVIGMYQAASGNRLIVSETNSDRVPLTKIKIAP